MIPWLLVTVTDPGGEPPGPDDIPGKLTRMDAPWLLRTITCLVLAILM